MTWLLANLEKYCGTEHYAPYWRHICPLRVGSPDYPGRYRNLGALFFPGFLQVTG